ncbi:MAG: Aspartyl-tRNA synthetase [Candidatus Levybacteria bacterium GW2011_GWC2_40_7]|nr:MAG: Aspartyl-tRNA synthetase [Candidatus Levybacteria bacterium GW2011_GWC2_40_7]
MQRTLIKDTASKAGEDVMLKGWVEVRRDHGKLVFLDIRDRSGIVQAVVIPQTSPAAYEVAQAIRPEFVVEIAGKVNKRPEKNINKDIPTGTVEIEVKSLNILSRSETPPFDLTTDGLEIGEEVRLRYRYLDLRRKRMQENLRLRSDYMQALRQALIKKDFVEIETPLLTKTTMEGARDFIVPSRFQPGKFYALPQSPQQYKQLLMVAGFERYFQFPHCLRDEDLRADRGFEHTQLDLEMSFVTREEVMQTVEDVVKEGVKAVGGKLKDETFPVVSYHAAMDKYGADKFDLRTEAEKKNGVLAFAWVTDFPFFRPVNKEEISDKFDSKSEWTFTHNPFSMPIPEHVERLLAGKNIGEILTTQYDLVCNGLEAGGGSIRAHTPELLKATYKIMGYSDSQIEESVGHMLEAFSFGAPPHGGIALGIDRHIALLKGELSIKETMAFPMTSSGRTSVMDAPASVPENILKELGIKVISDDKVSS